MGSDCITIKFKLKDENGNTYSSSSTTPVYWDLNYDVLDTIGAQLNAFLSQAGYCRPNGMIFMDSVTEEECDMLHDALDEYRKGNKTEKESK